jgi:4-amino-4-deoxy-L-arabinose transferase-like glycosyltransferase
VLLAALVAALTPFFLNLGGATIWDANEAYYVETPREMLESGDYINPSFNYEPRFNKPVLSYWVVAGLYHLFGVSVATERVAVVASALVMIAVAFVLGRAASADLDAGLLAALGLAAGPRFFMFSRRILIDVANSAALASILACFALAELYPEHRRRFLMLMYVAAGIGFLIKGPVAIVLPALAFLLYLGVQGELHRLRDMMLVPGAIVVLLIAAPWYVALYAQHGWTYITAFFLGENVERYLSPVGPNDARGYLFYLPVLLTDSFPWSLAAIGAAIATWRHRRDRLANPIWRIRMLLLIWCAVIVVFFSFSRSKQDLYIFPVAPAVAALGATFVLELLNGRTASERRWFAGTFTAVAGVLLLLGLLVVAVFVSAGSVYALDGALAVGVLAAAGGAGVGVLAWRDARLGAVACAVATLIAVNWLLAVRVLPGFEDYKPVAPLSAAIARQIRRDDVVAHFDLALPSMTYYLQRHIDVTLDAESLRRAAQRGRRVFAVMPASRYEELRPVFRAEPCVIARHKTADVKLRNVLAGNAPPEVIVVLSPCSRP